MFFLYECCFKHGQGNVGSLMKIFSDVIRSGQASHGGSLRSCLSQSALARNES